MPLRLALCLALAAGAARATVGPSFGLVRQEPDTPSVAMNGWEAGILALEPAGKGFWHFAGGRSKAPGSALTWGQARLNFAVVGGKAGFLFLGGGTGMGWLETTERRRLWLTSVDAGLLLNPLRAIEYVWPSCPCFSCLFGGHGLACSECLRTKDTATGMDAWRLGAEVGWRKAAFGLSGPEYRAWTAVVF